MTDEGGQKLSRRDFLKVATGAGSAYLAWHYGLSPVIERFSGDQPDSDELLGLESVSYSDSELDFIAKPDLMIDHPELLKKMKKDLIEWGKTGDETWRYEQRENDEKETGGIDLENWNKKADELVTEVKGWAEVLQEVIKDEKHHVIGEVWQKYYEYASYLRMTLLAAEYFREKDIKEVYDFMIGLKEEDIATVKLGADNMDLFLPEGFKRLEIHALWNYSWKDMAEGRLSGLHPLFGPIVTNGDDLVREPMFGSLGLLQDRDKDLEMDPWTLNNHPKESMIINFEPEVQKQVKKLLKRIGINRGVKSVSWMNIDSYPQGRSSPEGDAFVGGGYEVLDLEHYLEYQQLYDQLTLHEAIHALVNRSEMLGDLDRANFRDLMLKLAMGFDPLRDMKLIFAPEGKYLERKDYDSDMDYYLAEQKSLDYMHITNYYFTILKGIFEGNQAKDFIDELRSGLLLMEGGDIYEDLWPKKGTKGLVDYLDKLSKKMPDMQGISKFVAELVLNNREAVESGKRRIFGRESHFFELGYVTEYVLPLTLLHAALYHPEKMLKSLPEDVDENVAKSYLINWQQRAGRMVRGTPIEELAAEIISYMLTDYEKKADWGDTFDDFCKMLLILKDNGLAYKNLKKAV